MEANIGQSLDKRYRLDALLGRGGMGSVFRGYDLELQRTVAVKVMHPHLAVDPAFKERFLQEARAGARLKHRSIVAIYDSRGEGEQLYLVMEYVAGGTLASQMQGARAIDLRETLALLAQTSDALDYAHRQQIVHRDIKPSNILLEPLDKPERPGDPPLRALVADFGLAKLRDSTLHTSTGTFLGTLPYMSPEQCLAQPVDGRSDIYSVGVILYLLATGRLPLDIQSPTDAVMKHMHAVPLDPSAIRPDLPAAVQTAILKAIARSPNDRFQTAGDLADALRSAAAPLSQDAVTRWAGGAEVASLVTIVQAALPEPRGTSVLEAGPVPGIPAGQDAIQIQGKNQPTRWVPLSSGAMTIGRSSDNSIVLDVDDVSRHHARIDFDGTAVTVSDLGSTNGTFLANNRLLPNLPTPWRPDQVLRIAGMWLGLKRGGRRDTTTIVTSGGVVLGRAQIQTSSSEQVAAHLEQTALAVDAGGSVTTALIVRNQGEQVDHFDISVVGLPEAWLPSLPGSMKLMPGNQETVSLTLSPPRASGSRAGDHPFTVRIAGRAAPDQVADIPARLTISPYYDFRIGLRPERLPAGASGQLSVRNLGNADQSYQASWQDPADELLFQPAQATVAVAAGEESTQAFKALPRKRPWIGGKVSHPFTVTVVSGQGNSQMQPGQLISSGRIPPWIIPILLFLCIALSAAAALAYKASEDRNTRATKAVAATATAKAATATADFLATAQKIEQQNQTATALASATAAGEQALHTANEATRVAATTTAEWLGQDDDRDGLTNREEESHKTLPSKRDTDDDGLDDGDELRRGTNPLDPDSDDDGLKDGDEVAKGINPLNQDTDGDGIPDPRDPDPGRVPTPTYTPTPVPECTVESNDLNLRGGPGQAYAPPITALRRGTVLKPLAYSDVSYPPSGRWIQGQVVGTASTGWVSAAYVRCNVEIDALPVGQAPPTPTATVTPTPTAPPTPTPTPTPTFTLIPQEITINMLGYSASAEWGSGQLTEDLEGTTIDPIEAIPWMGSDGDERGFVILSAIDLEDGTYRTALRMHPKWVRNGTVKGWHRDLLNVVMPAEAVFEAQVGFVSGAGGTDGVNFLVYEHHFLPDGQEVWNPVLNYRKGYTGALDTVRVDLSQFAGQRVYLKLRVDAGPSAAQDWAVWINPIIRGKTVN